jgi:hypothetical protein
MLKDNKYSRTRAAIIFQREVKKPVRQKQQKNRQRKCDGHDVQLQFSQQRLRGKRRKKRDGQNRGEKDAHSIRVNINGKARHLHHRVESDGDGVEFHGPHAARDEKKPQAVSHRQAAKQKKQPQQPFVNLRPAPDVVQAHYHQRETDNGIKNAVDIHVAR